MSGAKIGIVGSGVIGRAWSMLFVAAGYRVMLYDNVPEQVSAALELIQQELDTLQRKGQLRGKSSAEEQYALIAATMDIKELAHDAVYIQECIPERLDWKQTLYAQLDDVLESPTIVASSTSTFMPSLFTAQLRHQDHMLVAHPLNPPYFIPLVELVPAPWTQPEVLARTGALMREIGQKPVTLAREVQGFATNRIQYAILNEVWRLVADNVISVADVDTVMSQGLGLRYALLGPLETAHLNAAGIADYVERFGQEIFAVSRTYGATPQMAPGRVLGEIAAQCEQLVPLAQLAERRIQRDRFLTELAKLKEQF